jgi:hypothetical protein
LKGGRLDIFPLQDDGRKCQKKSVFGRFRVSGAKFVSLGKLDQAIQEGIADFKYVIIDESHRFRSENTQRFALLKQICQQKGVILLSATESNRTIAVSLPCDKIKFFGSNVARMRGIEFQKCFVRIQLKNIMVKFAIR